MIKKLLISTISIFALLFTGCVERELLVEPKDSNSNTWAEKTNVNDVDTSDLDNNLTETETMITENGEYAKKKRVPFPIKEYKYLATSGKATVKGRIYVNDLHGDKVLGSGSRLYLNPVTSYSKQWYNESYLSGNKMEKADSRLFNYLRFTASNSSGEFAFYGVPSGSYYLIGTVKCGSECGYDDDKNIRIATKVSIYGNKVLEQDLTKSTN
ncbi:MAG: carboxypeptidase regulatory-like domain-containing protein [Campylobacterota bacterium]|nr:carboxypeptidase regulatory-like domain-containing protein [Campylobacterota bacterium]